MIICADAHLAEPTLFDNHDIDDWAQEYREKNQEFFDYNIDEWADKMKETIGVDRQLLNFYGPDMGLMYNTPAELAVKIMRIFNDRMLALSKKYHQFDCNIWLAVQDTQASYQELIRLEGQQYFGVHFGEQIPWGFIQDSAPIFDYLGQHRIPIYLHFANGLDELPLEKEILNPLYIRLKQAFPDPWQNYQIAIMSLIETGYFERWPDARVIQAEQGIAFIEQFCATAQLNGFKDPLPYLKKHFWFTIEIEDRKFISQANFIGWDRLLFATDWPHTNDAGGQHRYQDAAYANRMLAKEYINQHQYDLITHQNYLKLRTRS